MSSRGLEKTNKQTNMKHGTWNTRVGGTPTFTNVGVRPPRTTSKTPNVNASTPQYPVFLNLIAEDVSWARPKKYDDEWSNVERPEQRCHGSGLSHIANPVGKGKANIYGVDVGYGTKHGEGRAAKTEDGLGPPRWRSENVQFRKKGDPDE